LRGSPIEYRKRKLIKLMRAHTRELSRNEFFERDGDILFEHACKLGCEGIVSKRFPVKTPISLIAAAADRF